MEQEKELIKTFILQEKEIIAAEFELQEIDSSDEVIVKLKFGEQEILAKEDTYWEALNKLRIELEKENLLVKCFGASKNVYPSPMILNMGNGRLAYKLKEGKQALKDDLVDIFQFNEDIEPVTIETQETFYSNWLKSLQKK